MTQQELTTNNERLDVLAHEIESLVKRTPYELGKRLSEAREVLQGNIEFGAWCKAHDNFGLKQQTLHSYRQYFEFVHHHDGERLPTDWNIVARMATADDITQRRMLVYCDSHEKVTRKMFTEAFPREVRKDKGTAAVKRAQDQADAARDGLSLSAQKKVERAVKAEVKRVAAEFDKAVNETVAEQMKTRIAAVEERMHKAKEAELRAKAMVRDYSLIMTLEEYRLVLGCLHPDRARDERERKRLNKAFEIFKRVEATVNKKLPIAELRRRGWR